MTLIQEIRERRVLPAVGVYVGASWVVVEILDRLVERYYLSPYLTDIVFWGLYSLLPAVVLIAWTHGRPGKDRSTRAEKVGVPINLIATVGLLVTVFGGKDIGATADLVTVNNELGQKEEHYVPRDSFRRRTAVFFWNNESGEPALDWMQYGITELLTQDLQQNPFLLVDSPWQQLKAAFNERIGRADLGKGVRLPLSLMREIATLAGRDYFVDGTFDREGGKVRITARVWRTENLSQVAEISESGSELLPVVDKISEGVREALEVPLARGLAGDLPLVETYGESEAALQQYLRGLNAVLFDNDREASNAHYQAALEADPQFVLAWYMMGLNHWEQGEVAAAREALLQAQQVDFRLPERDRAMIKGLIYRISGEQQKLEKFLRLRVRLSGDADAYRHLAGFLMVTGRLEEAKEHFLNVMERDSADLDSLLQLAKLERSTGDLDAASQYVQRFLDRRPEDLSATLLMAELRVEAGDLQQARVLLEGAQLLDGATVLPGLRLAMLNARQANWSAAQSLIDAAREVAVTPMHEILVLEAQSFLELRRGRIRRAISLLDEMESLREQTASPFEQILSSAIQRVHYNLLLDRLDAAERQLARAHERLQPPLEQFLAFSEALLRARQRDFEGAESALRTGAAAVDHFKADYLAFQLPLVAGQIAEERGEYAAAARHFEQAIADAKRSIVGGPFRQKIAVFYGACAQMHVKAGELEMARSVLEQAFRSDSGEPSLWVARSMLQEASGAPRLALASVDYALAIWSQAEPDYIDYREALAWRDDLAAMLD